MANYDAEIRVGIKLNNSDFVKGANKIEDVLDNIEKKTKSEKKLKISMTNDEINTVEAQIDRILQKKKQLVQEPILNSGFQQIQEADINWENNAKEMARINAEVEAFINKTDQTDSKIIRTNEHINQLKVDVEEYVNELKRLENAGQYFGDTDYDRVYLAWQNAKYAVKEYVSELNKQTINGKKQVDFQRELQRIRDQAVVSDQNLIDLLEKQKRIVERIAKLKKAGVTNGYAEYENLQRALAHVNNMIREVREGFGQVEKSSKKTMNTVQGGTKKSNGLLGTLKSRLKGITLSLLIFNWITKGFNALVGDIGEGYGNLSEYSKDYANSVQSLKNANTQLSNSFATALAPAIQAFIPNLVSLINFANSAVNTVGQLIAYLSGSKTWTKATQVTDGYNDSLNDTAAAAKAVYKSLANFDELNVLNKNENASSSVTNGNESYFEEIPINNDVSAFGDKLKDSFLEVCDAIEPFRNALKDLWDGGLSKLGNFSIQGLKDLWEYFLSPLGTWAFGTQDEGFTRLIRIIDEDMSRIPWDEINKNLKEFWIAVEPYTEQFGEGLIDFFEHVSNLTTAAFIKLFGDDGALTDLTDWLNDNDPETARKWGYALGVLCSAIAGFVVTSKIIEATLKAREFLDTLGGLKNLGTISVLVLFTYSFSKSLPGLTQKKMEDEYEELTGDNTDFWNPPSQKDFDSLEDYRKATDEWIKSVEAFEKYKSEQPIIDVFGLKLYEGQFSEEWDLFCSEISERVSEWQEDNNEKREREKAEFDMFIAALKVLAVEGLMNTITFVQNTAGELWNNIVTYFAEERWREQWDNVKTAASKMWTGLVEWWDNSAVGKWWNDNVKPWFNIETWLNLLKSIPDAFQSAFQSAVDIVAGIIEDLFGWIGNQITVFGKGKSKDIILKGAKSVLSVGTVSRYSLDFPALASGAVIRGGNPYLAWLGDQPIGQTNIEAPLDTIRQAVREELRTNGSSGEINLTVNLDGNAVYKSVVRKDQMFRKSTGHSAFVF